MSFPGFCSSYVDSGVGGNGEQATGNRGTGNRGFVWV